MSERKCSAVLEICNHQAIYDRIRKRKGPSAQVDSRSCISAYRLQQRHPGISVEVVEKEPAVAMHQTGRNSGVVHAGIYYAPGSQKAQLCVSGGRQLREYCAARGLVFQECGKLVVARGSDEVPRLRDLLERGRANGVRDLRWIDGDALGEVEPHAQGVAAVHSTHTAIVDCTTISHRPGPRRERGRRHRPARRAGARHRP
jgi:L-2-hydroxyglutarate oxidase